MTSHSSSPIINSPLPRVHRHFEDELDTLRSQLIRMGSLVDEQIETAIRALDESNLELAKFVLAREERVNELDLTIEGQCQRIFALTQPVAVDLRLLLAAMRMNSDFERIGDIAVNIAERVDALEDYSSLVERWRQRYDRNRAADAYERTQCLHPFR
jgi:phosphate uptake regulator